jgi:hypothetical protein
VLGAFVATVNEWPCLPPEAEKRVRPKKEEIVMKLSLVGCVCLLGIACSKPSPEEQKRMETELNAALASAMATPSSAARAGDVPRTVVATCKHKDIPKCEEIYNDVSKFSEDMCKESGATFARGSTPCPTENLLGTCLFKPAAADANGQKDFYYKGAGDNKGSCEALKAEWTPAAEPAKPSAAKPSAAKPSAAKPSAAKNAK